MQICLQGLMRKAACKFAFKSFYDLGQLLLNAMFELHVSEEGLRSNKQLNAVVPRCKTQFAERNFAVRAVVYWNLLPMHLKQDTLPENVKAVLKEYNDL